MPNGHGIQNRKPFNESNNNNDAKSKKNYSTPINDTKKDSPTVNNNNHNYDDWVVEQKIKYKLLALPQVKGYPVWWASLLIPFHVMYLILAIKFTYCIVY